MVNEETIKLGDSVVILDEMLHQTKIEGIINFISGDTFIVSVTNGLNKGQIKKIKSLYIRKV